MFLKIYLIDYENLTLKDYILNFHLIFKGYIQAIPLQVLSIEALLSFKS